MIRLPGVWRRYLKYYEAMRDAFPDEPIWNKCIEDTKSLLQSPASLPSSDETGDKIE